MMTSFELQDPAELEFSLKESWLIPKLIQKSYWHVTTLSSGYLDNQF